MGNDIGKGGISATTDAHTFTDRIYVLRTTETLGPHDPIREAFTSPHTAYRRLIDHAGETPPDGEPEWPEVFGEKVWGWYPDDGSTGYTISEWVRPPKDAREDESLPTADELDMTSGDSF